MTDQTLALADERRWYSEHTALLISTLKWALLGAAAGICVGLGTRAFLGVLGVSIQFADSHTIFSLPTWVLLPVALPLCVWVIRAVAPDAKGHGTEAVIAAVHQRSGRIDWKVAPVKLVATIATIACGGSAGKEGPAAQIGAALMSLFADIFRLTDEDRQRIVICGISAGFAAVFGTPVSGALFGIEVLYLGRFDYSVMFPALVAGIVAHLACGVQGPFPVVHESLGSMGNTRIVFISIACGIAFGLIALLLIESMRALDRLRKQFENRPLLVAATGGVLLVSFYTIVGDRYSGLGTETIDAMLTGTTSIAGAAFLYKIAATSITLESGGSGGILTPIFFIGTTSGAVIAKLAGWPQGLIAAFGFVALLAAAANTPIAAAVMAIELLPAPAGVYAALAAGTAFLMVGHRSVYASQKLGFSKSAGLEMELHGSIGDLDLSHVRIRKGSLAERVHNLTIPGVRSDDDQRD